jgi:hypothetical protein
LMLSFVWSGWAGVHSPAMLPRYGINPDINRFSDLWWIGMSGLDVASSASASTEEKGNCAP